MSLLAYVEKKAVPKRDTGELARQLREVLYQQLSSETIARLAKDDPERVRTEVTAVLELQLRGPRFAYVSEEEGHRAIRDVLDMILGLGPIEHLLHDPEITEIMVNAHDAVFYERDGRIFRSDASFVDDAQLRLVIDRIVAPLGRRVDEQSPMVSARLPQGHRVNAIIPPISIDGPVLTIRKFRETIFTLDDLVAMGSVSETLAVLLAWAVKARRSVAVSGGTGGGKTTLLNALSCEIDPRERIITIEDSAELRFFHHPHVVRLEARAMNVEGTGEVTIRDLVTNALRMRPDRIVVGECRGAEALDMLQAMNTGHDGSMTTLHASSPREVVARLVMMSRFGCDLPVGVIEEQISTALDLIVQQDRLADGSRKITGIVSVGQARREGGEGFGVEITPIARWDRARRAYVFGTAPQWLDELPYLGIASAEEVDRWRERVGL